MKKNYKFSITLKKSLKDILIGTVAVVAAGLIAQYPAIADYNISGGAIVFIVSKWITDWLRHR